MSVPPSPEEGGPPSAFLPSPRPDVAGVLRIVGAPVLLAAALLCGTWLRVAGVPQDVRVVVGVAAGLAFAALSGHEPWRRDR